MAKIHIKHVRRIHVNHKGVCASCKQERPLDDMGLCKDCPVSTEPAKDWGNKPF